jgi:hypothetical protein
MVLMKLTANHLCSVMSLSSLVMITLASPKLSNVITTQTAYVARTKKIVLTHSAQLNSSHAQMENVWTSAKGVMEFGIAGMEVMRKNNANRALLIVRQSNLPAKIISASTNH